MEPPVHLRVVSRSDYLLGVVVRVIPLLLFIGGATTYLILLGRRDDHSPVEVLSLCGLVCFGILAIGLVLPHLGRRIRGFAELRSASAGVLAANQLIEAGRPVEAAAKYDAIAADLVGTLPGYHVVVAMGSATAHGLAGELELALSVMEAIERSGWVRSFGLFAHRNGIAASMTLLRAIAGDVAGAERAHALARGVRHANALATTLAVVAARRGDERARRDLAELLASGRVETVRGRVTVLVVLGTLAGIAKDDAEEARIATELKALRPRIVAHFRSGWPEARVFLDRHDLRDEAAG